MYFFLLLFSVFAFANELGQNRISVQNDLAKWKTIDWSADRLSWAFDANQKRWATVSEGACMRSAQLLLEPGHQRFRAGGKFAFGAGHTQRLLALAQVAVSVQTVECDGGQCLPMAELVCFSERTPVRSNVQHYRQRSGGQTLLRLRPVNESERALAAKCLEDGSAGLALWLEGPALCSTTRMITGAWASLEIDSAFVGLTEMQPEQESPATEEDAPTHKKEEEEEKYSTPTESDAPTHKQEEEEEEEPGPVFDFGLTRLVTLTVAALAVAALLFAGMVGCYALENRFLISRRMQSAMKAREAPMSDNAKEPPLVLIAREMDFSTGRCKWVRKREHASASASGAQPPKRLCIGHVKFNEFMSGAVRCELSDDPLFRRTDLDQELLFVRNRPDKVDYAALLQYKKLCDRLPSGKERVFAAGSDVECLRFVKLLRGAISNNDRSVLPLLLQPAAQMGSLQHVMDDEHQRRLLQGRHGLVAVLQIAAALDYLHRNHTVAGHLSVHSVQLRADGQQPRYRCLLACMPIAEDEVMAAYSAPELLSSGVRQPSVDVYAFGQLCWQVLATCLDDDTHFLKPYPEVAHSAVAIRNVVCGARARPYSDGLTRLHQPPPHKSAFVDVCTELVDPLTHHSPGTRQSLAWARRRLVRQLRAVANISSNYPDTGLSGMFESHMDAGSVHVLDAPAAVLKTDEDTLECVFDADRDASLNGSASSSEEDDSDSSLLLLPHDHWKSAELV